MIQSNNTLVAHSLTLCLSIPSCVPLTVLGECREVWDSPPTSCCQTPKEMSQVLKGRLGEWHDWMLCLKGMSRVSFNRANVMMQPCHAPGCCTICITDWPLSGCAHRPTCVVGEAESPWAVFILCLHNTTEKLKRLVLKRRLKQCTLCLTMLSQALTFEPLSRKVPSTDSAIDWLVWGCRYYSGSFSIWAL